MDMDIKLNSVEVEEAVKAYIEQKYNLTVGDVKLVVGNNSYGYGPNEYTSPGFKYAECKIKQ